MPRPGPARFTYRFSEVPYMFRISIKSGRSAVDHSRYITRQKPQQDAEQLVYHEVLNLPPWAPTPEYHWRTGQRFERKNGAVYREFETSLPNELRLEQNIELVRRFAAAALPEKVTEIAIHAHPGSISGVTNTHAHFMFSDRLPDEFARCERTWFRRFNPDNPAAGGCRKDNCGKSRAQLSEDLTKVRTLFAQLTNEALETAGVERRVSAESNRVRGLPPPEPRLPHFAVRELTSKEKAEIVARRRSNVL